MFTIVCSLVSLVAHVVAIFVIYRQTRVISFLEGENASLSERFFKVDGGSVILGKHSPISISKTFEPPIVNIETFKPDWLPKGTYVRNSIDDKFYVYNGIKWVLVD